MKSDCEAALFGAVSSPLHKVQGYSSPIVQLRKQLDLYANVRPVKSLAGAKALDLVIVRENTEDLYVKEERTYDAPNGEGKVAEAIKRITSRASARIARIAGDIALARQKIRDASEVDSVHGGGPLVTVSSKPNVLTQTDGLFRETCLQVLAEEKYKQAGLRVEHQIIDSLFYKMIRNYSQYDVIVAPNLYGDLLSDAAGAFVGSLGLIPSANVGDKFVIGEPCHGSAPDIEGKGIANPIATMRSCGVMLEFLHEEQAAARIYEAVDATLRDGVHLTPDMGGKSSTKECVDDVLKNLQDTEHV